MSKNIKILSPTHIGSGIEISPVEYLVENDLFRLNLENLFDDPDFKPMMEQVIQSAANQRYIGELVPKELLKKHVKYKIPIRQTASEYLEYHKTEIKSIIKTAGRVYIPGSSIKGSILSAMFWYVLKEYTGDEKKKIEQLIVEGSGYDVLTKLVYRKFLPEEYDETNINLNFLRWLDVTDSNYLTIASKLEISLVKRKGAENENAQPILYETLIPGTEFEINIISKLSRFKVTDILEICDKFYRRVLEKDGNPNIASNNYLLRLGQGSSAFSTSLLILAEDLGISNYKIASPTTRKRIDDHFAMGWIELS